MNSKCINGNVPTLVLCLCLGIIGHFTLGAVAADLPKGTKVQADSAKVAQGDEKNRVSTRKLNPISELLKGASPAAKEEFLGSLVLIDGKVASATITLLKRDLGEARVQQILLELFPARTNPPTIAGPHKGLCGNRVCYNSVCTGSSDHHYCVDSNSDSVCSC